MAILSLTYAAVVLAIVMVFQFCPSDRRASFLAVASFGIYATYSLASSGVLLLVCLAVFAGAKAIEKAPVRGHRRTVSLALLISLLLSYLVVIKVLPDLKTSLVSRFSVATGVSYYTFKLISYVIDVYWEKYPAWTRLDEFLAYAAFFPQLTAGPIQRPNEFSIPPVDQHTAGMMIQGLRRILFGCVKKIVVADQLAAMVAHISGLEPGYSNLNWVLAYLYAIQLYADFSALTDIAIGTADLFGIRSPENFAFPYFAPTISQFWRRWHMSLTRWLTDYVFTPLRMATRDWGKLGLVLSILINMVLIGLWHGFAIGFFLFGVVHGVLLVMDSVSANLRRRFYREHAAADKLTNALGPIVVFHMLVFTLVLFRAGSWNNVLYQVTHLLDGVSEPREALRTLYWGYGRSRTLMGFATLVAFAGTEWTLYLRKDESGLLSHVPAFAELPRAVRWASYYAGLALACVFHQQVTHFIYAQF